MRPICNTLHGFFGDFGLDIVCVVGDGSDKRNLEGLLDDSVVI